MSCDEFIRIVQGSDREFSVRLIDGDTKEPIDLTGVAETDIVAKFLAAAGGCVDLTGSGPITITSPLGGKIKITMSQANTAALKVGTALDFQVDLTKSSKKSSIIFVKILNVKPKICS